MNKGLYETDMPESGNGMAQQVENETESPSSLSLHLVHLNYDKKLVSVDNCLVASGT